MEYDPDTTAVVVVDMQNDFCHPDGALYAEGSEAVIENVNEVVRSVDSAETYFTQDTHEEDDPEFEQWGEHCLRNSWGFDFHEDLVPAFPPNVIQKDTYDAFHETNFDAMLTDNGIETLIICGTLANVCVQETASSAALNGYEVIVVGNAVGYINEDQLSRALDHIDFLIGEVVTLEEL